MAASWHALQCAQVPLLAGVMLVPIAVILHEAPGTVCGDGSRAIFDGGHRRLWRNQFTPNTIPYGSISGSVRRRIWIFTARDQLGLVDVLLPPILST